MSILCKTGDETIAKEVCTHVTYKFASVLTFSVHWFVTCLWTICADCPTSEVWLVRTNTQAARPLPQTSYHTTLIITRSMQGMCVASAAKEHCA